MKWEQANNLHKVGHWTFVFFARCNGKNKTFIYNVCVNQRCRRYIRGTN